MTLISRGFGALQRIITRGFFSGAPPSPDCIVAFIGTITPPVNEPVGFQGDIYDTKAFTGDICDNCDC